MAPQGPEMRGFMMGLQPSQLSPSRPLHSPLLTPQEYATLTLNSWHEFDSLVLNPQCPTQPDPNFFYQIPTHPPGGHFQKTLLVP